MTATFQPTATFAVEGDFLIHQVVPRRGEPYKHQCPKASFEQVAHAVEEFGEHGFTLESLLKYEREAGRNVTFTNIAVTLAFLRERGMLEVHFRRNYAATTIVHLDAMTEFYALAEDG